MPTEVILPRVDMDMTEGRVSRWFVEEGATVAKGQPLFEMETDKAAMEIEAPASGTIREISDKLDTPLPVGSPVAWIYGEGEVTLAAKMSEPATEEARPSPQTQVERPAPANAPVAPSRDDAPSGARATPLARRLAREQGLDIAGIVGSGPKGRVQAQDVEAPSGSREPGGLGTDRSFPARIAERPEGRESRTWPKENGFPSLHAPSERSAGNDKQSAPLHRQWLRQGEGPPLVLIHGFGASLDAWRLFVATLQPEWPVLAVDLPGHGGSAARRITGFADMVEAVAATLQAERLGALHLSGHSLGGAVAAALAARQDIAARSLFLVAPGGLGPDINGAFLDGLLRATAKAGLAPWIALLASSPDALGPAFIEATLRQLSAEGAREGLLHVARTLFPDGTQAFGVREAFERIAVPTKVVAGTDDRIIPHRHADGLPGHVAIHRFAGVGHMPQFERREEVARLQREVMRAAAEG